MADAQLPCPARVVPRILTISHSTIAPETIRTVVNVAGSAWPVASAMRHSSEFAANATIAAAVRTAVRVVDIGFVVHPQIRVDPPRSAFIRGPVFPPPQPTTSAAGDRYSSSGSAWNTCHPNSSNADSNESL